MQDNYICLPGTRFTMTSALFMFDVLTLVLGKSLQTSLKHLTRYSIASAGMNLALT